MREDLLRLTPEALAQLTNMGLLKRAQRDLDEGIVPTITVDERTLSAMFPDGTRCLFAPSAGLKESSCSCNAPMCRHRIAAVLHYRNSSSQSASPSKALPAPKLPTFVDLTDDLLAKVLAPSVWKQVQTELQKPVLINIDVQNQSGSTVYTARLSQASVRFYAGADLAIARCDCVQQQRCVHMGLGAMAIRAVLASGQISEQMNSATVEIGAAHAISNAQQAELRVLDTSLHTLQRALFEHGLAFDAANHCAQALSSCHQSAKKVGATWISMALDDLEACLANYQSRSAAFSFHDALALTRELAMRARALRPRNEGEPAALALSMQAVLGMSEAMESPLDRLSLVSLGLRVQNDGSERTAMLAVVDTDTQTLMVLQKSWQRSGESEMSELALTENQRIGTLRMSSLAKGSLITTTAKRRANGELKLGQSFSGKAAVTPHSGDFSTLRTPLLINNQQDYLRQRQLALPPELGARILLRNFHVLAVSQVNSVFFDAANQCLCARVQDQSEATWLIKREYNAAAPGALDALAKALLDATADSAIQIRYICGPVRIEHGECVVEPWALCLIDPAAADLGKATGTFLVPDLAAKSKALGQALLGQIQSALDPIAIALVALNECLIALLRDGALSSNTTRAGCVACSLQLRQVGLLLGSSLLDRLIAVLANQAAIEKVELMAALFDLQVYAGLAEHGLSNLEFDDS